MKPQRVASKGRREPGPRRERRPMEAAGGSLGGALDRFIRPGPLTKRTNDENDDETESCEEKGAQGRSQGTQGQARREEGCDQTRSSGGRGSRAASPDRQESLTPSRPEGRQAAPGRRPEGRGSPRCPEGRGSPRCPEGRGSPRCPEGRGSPRCPQGGGARQGAPHRQESRRASPRGQPGREEKAGRCRNGIELAHAPVDLSLIAST